jgi:hypothetical protein
MVFVPQERLNSIQAVVQVAVQRRTLSRNDHLDLTSTLLADPTITPSDRVYINRLLDYIRQGKVRLVD